MTDGDGSEVEPRGGRDDLLPFTDLHAPEPLDTTPPTTARWLAFTGILVGGLLGGLIGFGTADLLGWERWVAVLIGVLFAIGGAAGVGIVAQLTLRAMNEWRGVHHPEADR